MKDFRFKVYSKISKKILDIISIDFQKRKCFLKENQNDIEVSFDDIELLSWIGLKDKNGLFIYEGDILLDDMGRTMVVKMNDYGRYSFFALNKEDSNIFNKYHGVSLSSWFLPEISVEVVGNIYNKNISI